MAEGGRHDCCASQTHAHRRDVHTSKWVMRAPVRIGQAPCRPSEDGSAARMLLRACAQGATHLTEGLAGLHEGQAGAELLGQRLVHQADDLRRQVRPAGHLRLRVRGLLLQRGRVLLRAGLLLHLRGAPRACCCEGRLGVVVLGVVVLAGPTGAVMQRQGLQAGRRHGCG